MHLYDILKRQNYRDREQISGCQGLGVGEILTTKRQHMKILGADGAVLYPDYGGNSHTDLVLKLLELYANDYKVILPYTDCKKHTSEVIKM